MTSETEANEFHLHTSINISAGRSSFTSGSFYRENYTWEERQDFHQENHLLELLDFDIKDAQKTMCPSLPTSGKMCTNLPDKGTSSHFSN